MSTIWGLIATFALPMPLVLLVLLNLPLPKYVAVKRFEQITNQIDDQSLISLSLSLSISPPLADPSNAESTLLSPAFSICRLSACSSCYT